MNVIAFYMRFSGGDLNGGESESVSNQRDLLRNYVNHHGDLSGYEVVEFVDDGFSGASFERPALNKMLGQVGGEIGVILVKDFSRFGRNLIEVGRYIDQIFPSLGVRFIAVNEGYDSENYEGHTAGIDVGLRAFIGEMYSMDCSAKIKSAKRVQLQNGEYIGGLPFYGYMKSVTAKNKLVANPDTSAVVERIFRLACEGQSVRSITHRLNADGVLSPRMYLKSIGKDTMRGTRAVRDDEGIWLTSTVRRVLKDVRYTGVQVSGKTSRIGIKKSKKNPPEKWIIAENAHEAIITSEQFELAQKNFGTNKSAKKTANRDRNIFKRTIKCGCCDRTMSLFKDQKVPCYRCNTPKFIQNAECVDFRIGEDFVKNIVLTELQMLIELFLKPQNGSRKNDNSAIERRIEFLENSKAVVFEKMIEGRISRKKFKMQMQKVDDEIRGICGKMEEVEVDFSGKNHRGITELTGKIVSCFIDEIVIYEGRRAEIKLSFQHFNIKC